MTVADLYLCIIDADGSISQMSPGGEALLGWSAGELLGRDLFDMIPRNQLPMRRAINRSVIVTGRPYSALSEFVGKSGAPVYVDTTIAARRDQNGNIDGVVGLWQPLETFRDYPADPIPYTKILPTTSDYVVAMIRELACLVGPTDDRLRAYLLSTLKVAMQADYHARVKAIMDDAKVNFGLALQ